MPLVSLTPVLEQARAHGGYAMGLVCLSWEDAQMFVAAGEAADVPVILQAGPGARKHMPVSLWGAMFHELGRAAKVPVVAHLDHGASVDECAAALEAGFTSVMYDGSHLPLADNICNTREAARLAHKFGASIEAEIGIVGYAEGQTSRGTDPAEAAAMAELDIDALAISLGNVHLQTGPDAHINWDLAKEISRCVAKPLVIHGGSGVAAQDRGRLAAEFGVAKINVGTELRQIYGSELRRQLAADETLFDRLAIGRAIRPRFVEAAAGLLRSAWR